MYTSFPGNYLCTAFTCGSLCLESLGAWRWGAIGHRPAAPPRLLLLGVPMTMPGLPTSTPKPSWYRRTWVTVTGVAVLGLILGAAVGSSSGPEISPAAQKQIDAAHDAQHQAETDRDDARAAQQQAESERDQARNELNAAQADLTTRGAALDKRKADLDTREKKVSGAEAAAKANSFGGDGIYLVGTDIQPGTYKAGPSPSGNCYSEVDRDLNDTINSIISNNNTSGPVVLNVPGTAKAVKVDGCAEFHKVA